jgi:N-acetylneuraminate synthase/N,N'-diacetyllegionaminate synthase
MSERRLKSLFNKLQPAKDGVFIIAEAGVNHNGSLELAMKLVDAARKAKADAVKFQTFKAEELVASSAAKAEYQKKSTGAHESQLEMIKKLELSLDDFAKLKKYCDRVGIIFLSTGFDSLSIDFLDKLKMPAFKIPSGEITNIPLLKHIAAKKKPVLISTGMCNISEVEQAINTVHSNGAVNVALFHCTSNYPAKMSDLNLKAMHTMSQAFGVPVGYSDHTLGIEIPVAAVAMGAVIVEKHFTLSQKMEGPDHKASLEPEALQAMIKAIRNVEKSLGDGVKRPTSAEADTAKVARRSIVAARNIKAGSVLKSADLTCKRPGTGIPPIMLEALIGRKTNKEITSDSLINWSDIG